MGSEHELWLAVGLVLSLGLLVNGVQGLVAYSAARRDVPDLDTRAAHLVTITRAELRR